MVQGAVEDALSKPTSDWKGPAQGINYDVTEKGKNMESCGKAIKYLREGDFLSYIRQDLNKKPEMGGFDLPEDKIISIPEENLLDGDDPFNKVNTEETLKANPDAFGTREKRVLFRTWLRNYGKDNWRSTTFPDYTDAAKSHYQTLQTWKTAYKSIKNQNKGLSCK